MEGGGNRETGGWRRVAGLRSEAWREKNLKVSLFHGVSILQNSVINLERTHTHTQHWPQTHTHENINIAFAYILWKAARLTGLWGRVGVLESQKMYIQMGRDGGVANGRPRKSGGAMSCCYCFN